MGAVRMRTVRSTEYHLSATRTPLRVCVAVTGNGAGSVTGWIWRDWQRAALVDAYLVTLPGLLWERGDAFRFVYAFGAHALSRKRRSISQRSCNGTSRGDAARRDGGRWRAREQARSRRTAITLMRG